MSTLSKCEPLGLLVTTTTVVFLSWCLWFLLPAIAGIAVVMDIIIAAAINSISTKAPFGNVLYLFYNVSLFDDFLIALVYVDASVSGFIGELATLKVIPCIMVCWRIVNGEDA